MATVAMKVFSPVQLKNILVCTDFSPASAEAIPYAAGLAKAYEAKLHLLHVRPATVYLGPPPEEWTGLAEESEAVVRNNAETLLAPYAEIKSDVTIAEGAIWPAIEEQLEKNAVDLIVLGTKGRTGFGKLLLGSVAEEIFRKAPCAVITVGPHATQEPKVAGEMSNILFATDFSPASLSAAPLAMSLAQEHEARLTLLHVIADEKTGEFVVPANLTGASKRLLQNLIPPEGELWCKPNCLVEQGEAAEKILDVAGRTRADLIILGVKRPKLIEGAATHLFNATAHKIVSNARCPVLTVRG